MITTRAPKEPAPLPFGIGIPYSEADCAELTVLVLCHCGIAATNP